MANVKLTDVCKTIFAGGDVPKDNYSLEQDEIYSIPIYTNGEQNNGLYGYTTKARVSEPSITVSARGTIGFTAIRTMPFYPAIRLITLTPNEKIDIRYLYYVTQNYKFDNGGTSIPQLTVPMLKSYSFPLPPLETQRKIAANLDKVTHTIDLCNAILEKLDLLVKSRFVEMFGDPVANPYNFPIKTYGALFELNAGGTPSKAKKEYWENGTISWIGSNMCQDSIIYENDGKYITQEGYDNSSAKMFPIDTVLIALVGATIGKTALLKFETSTNQNVLGVRGITDAGYNPLFVYYYTQFLHSKFLNIGDGGFNMASKGFVSELPIYDIAIDYQNQFAIFAEQTDKSKSAVKKLLEKAETLKKALMQEYFG